MQTFKNRKVTQAQSPTKHNFPSQGFMPGIPAQVMPMPPEQANYTLGALRCWDSMELILNVVKLLNCFNKYCISHFIVV